MNEPTISGNEPIPPSAVAATAVDPSALSCWVLDDSGALCQTVEKAANIRDPDRAFVRLSAVKALLSRPQQHAQVALICWSCKKSYMPAQRSDCDGDCPHCGAELDESDALSTQGALSDDEQAAAWMAVTVALDKGVPGWLSGPLSGLDSAVKAISELCAARPVVADLAIVVAANTHLATTDYIWTADVDQLCAFARAILASQQPAEAPSAPFQQRVQPWMMECFGAEISADKAERNHRFFEEATELVQACGMTSSEAHQLVDYTYGRDIGDPAQEVGGVMVTLAALCLANGMDMHAAGETELARIWTKVDVIRAKQAAKPKHSPLPAAAPAIQQERAALDERAHEIQRCGINYVYVRRDAVEWLKKYNPVLCIKSGLCERIGNRLYTRSTTDDDALAHHSIVSQKDAQIRQLQAALVLALAPVQPAPVAVPLDRLQNWIDVIHDNKRSMGDRLQSLSSIFGGLLRGDGVDKYPLQPIREQQPDSERDVALIDWISTQPFVRIRPCERGFEVYWHGKLYPEYINVAPNIRDALQAAMTTQQGEKGGAA